VIDIHYKKCVGQATHILDAADAALQLFHGTCAHQRFFLGQLVKGAIGLLGLQVTQALYGCTNSFVVSEHTTQPAMADIGHSGAFSLLPHDLSRGALCTDKQYLVFVAGQSCHQVQCFIKSRNCMLEVDDMNFVTGTEDILVHFRVPVTGLVAKVSARLQQVAHTYLHLRHSFIPCIGLVLHISHASTSRNWHPESCDDMCVSLVPLNGLLFSRIEFVAVILSKEARFITQRGACLKP